MRILVVTTGTRGDVEPFLALADALTARGHAITISADTPYLASVEATGYTSLSLGEPTTEAAYQEAARQALRESDPMRRADVVIERWLAPLIRSKVEELERRRRDYDLVIVGCLFSVLATRIGYEIARPAVVGVYMPTPPEMLRRLHLRGIGSLLAWSSEVLAVDDYATPSSEITGYWFRSPRSQPLSEPLEEFLAAGPPPVIFTFGSMAGFRPEHLDRTIEEAVRISGQRAIIHGGNAGLGDSLVGSPLVFRMEEMDCERLFPRAACIVHHGGSGTTASVLRAGKPSVVMPVWGDQQIWAERLLSLGASAGTLELESLSAQHLASLITRALDDPGVGRVAQRLSASIDRDPGVVRAAERIEAIARTPAR